MLTLSRALKSFKSAMPPNEQQAKEERELQELKVKYSLLQARLNEYKDTIVKLHKRLISSVHISLFLDAKLANQKLDEEIERMKTELSKSNVRFEKQQKTMQRNLRGKIENNDESFFSTRRPVAKQRIKATPATENPCGTN